MNYTPLFPCLVFLIITYVQSCLLERLLIDRLSEMQVCFILLLLFSQIYLVQRELKPKDSIWCQNEYSHIQFRTQDSSFYISMDPLYTLGYTPKLFIFLSSILFVVEFIFFNMTSCGAHNFSFLKKRGGREGEGDGGKHHCVVASCTPPLGT